MGVKYCNELRSFPDDVRRQIDIFHSPSDNFDIESARFVEIFFEQADHSESVFAPETAQLGDLEIVRLVAHVLVVELRENNRIISDARLRVFQKPVEEIDRELHVDVAKEKQLAVFARFGADLKT